MDLLASKLKSVAFPTKIQIPNETVSPTLAIMYLTYQANCLLNGMVWLLQVFLQRQEEGEVPLPGQEPQTFQVLLTIKEVLMAFD